MSEIVALVAGGAAKRRHVLEYAANYVGHRGTVHAIRDGMPPSLLAGAVMLAGLLDNVDQMDTADFAETARILAPIGCGWTWFRAPFGARKYAVNMARHHGIPLVLPSMRGLRGSVPVRVVAPDGDPSVWRTTL